MTANPQTPAARPRVAAPTAPLEPQACECRAGARDFLKLPSIVNGTRADAGRITSLASSVPNFLNR